MAKMGGCEVPYYTKLKSQGTGRIAPGKSARNNMSMGGTNTMEAKSGKTGMGTSHKARKKPA